MTSSITKRNIAFWSGLAAIPLGVGLLVGRRSKVAGAVAGGLTALGLGALRWQLVRLFTDEPEYIVEEHVGALEIRSYPMHVEARTQIATTNYDSALTQGFTRLARYIFGGNVKHEKLSMTAPVTAQSERLAMTSPVIAEQSSETAFTIAFVMPPGRGVETLPTPIDHRVELDEVPERRVAVLRFSGRRDATSLPEREQELMRLVREAGLEVAGAPMYAGFDPPTTLPFLRRNEVWVELR